MSFSFLPFCKKRAEIIFKKIIYSILILFTFVFHLIIGFWLVYMEISLHNLLSVMSRFEHFLCEWWRTFVSLSINQKRNNNLIIDFFEVISRWRERRKFFFALIKSPLPSWYVDSFYLKGCRVISRVSSKILIIRIKRSKSIEMSAPGFYLFLIRSNFNSLRSMNHNFLVSLLLRNNLQF